MTQHIPALVTSEWYLEQANEAEKIAEAVRDHQVRETWLTIAKSYRDLARRYLVSSP